MIDDPDREKAEQRLLRHQMLDPAEAETMDLSGALALPTPHGSVYPSFQFDFEHRRVYPIAREANKFLDAQRDPWGTAEWWYGHDPFLGIVPADCVGDPQSEELIRRSARLAIQVVE